MRASRGGAVVRVLELESFLSATRVTGNLVRVQLFFFILIRPIIIGINFISSKINYYNWVFNFF